MAACSVALEEEGAAALPVLSEEVVLTVAEVMCVAIVAPEERVLRCLLFGGAVVGGGCAVTLDVELLLF
jgi:hypothetical protein